MYLPSRSRPWLLPVLVCAGACTASAPEHELPCGVIAFEGEQPNPLNHGDYWCQVESPYTRRDASGLVSCHMRWVFPPASENTCSDRAWLQRVEGTGDAGAALECEVAQVPVLDVGGVLVPAAGEGFYLEDSMFEVGAERVRECLGPGAGFAFTAQARPPPAAQVLWTCTAPAQVDVPTTDVPAHPQLTQPAIGSPCDHVLRNGQRLSGDAACELLLEDLSRDTRMFCHPTRRSCALSCDNANDCPAGWACTSEQAAGRDLCTHPLCSESS